MYVCICMYLLYVVAWLLKQHESFCQRQLFDGLKSGGPNHNQREERGAESAEGHPFPPREGSPEFFYLIFELKIASFCAFWELIAVELSVLHASAGKRRLWLVKVAVASLCVKMWGGGFCIIVPLGLKSEGTRPPFPAVDTPLLFYGQMAIVTHVDGSRRGSRVFTAMCLSVCFRTISQKPIQPNITSGQSIWRKAASQRRQIFHRGEDNVMRHRPVWSIWRCCRSPAVVVIDFWLHKAP